MVQRAIAGDVATTAESLACRGSLPTRQPRNNDDAQTAAQRRIVVPPRALIDFSAKTESRAEDRVRLLASTDLPCDGSCAKF